MQLILMRHGRVPSNEKHLYVSRTDESLSDSGRQDALAAGTCNQVDHVYVSSLKRTQETARICFPHAKQHVYDDLCELDFGVFEGRSAQEMEDDAAYTSWVDGGCVDVCPQGESRSQMTKRVAVCLKRILLQAADDGKARVVVVCHGGTIMTAMESFVVEQSDDPYRYFSWQVDNCCGYAVQVDVDADTIRFTSYEPFSSLDCVM